MTTLKSTETRTYFIQHYLMEIRYEEGSDIRGFFIDLERAIEPHPKPPCHP